MNTNRDFGRGSWWLAAPVRMSARCFARAVGSAAFLVLVILGAAPTLRGQDLAELTPDIQEQFRRQWGDQAEQQWTKEHERDIGTPGWRDAPSGGSAPRARAGAPSGPVEKIATQVEFECYRTDSQGRRLAPGVGRMGSPIGCAPVSRAYPYLEFDSLASLQSYLDTQLPLCTARPRSPVLHAIDRYESTEAPLEVWFYTAQTGDVSQGNAGCVWTWDHSPPWASDSVNGRSDVGND